MFFRNACAGEPGEAGAWTPLTVLRRLEARERSELWEPPVCGRRNCRCGKSGMIRLELPGSGLFLGLPRVT